MPSSSQKLSTWGIESATASKVCALADAAKPWRVAELRLFLGLLNYYGKFHPNLAARATPLYDLLRKNSVRVWNKTQRVAFQSVKKLLQSYNVLVHFDPEKQLILACDAFPYKLGALLSHCMEDGSDRPIAFTSCTSGRKKILPAQQENLVHCVQGRDFISTCLADSLLFTLIANHSKTLLMGPRPYVSWHWQGSNDGP